MMMTIFKGKLTRVVFAIALASLGVAAPRRAVAQSSPPSIPAGALLDVWDFADTNYLSDLDYSPSSLTNVSFVSTWAGSSLLVDNTNAAWINYAVVESDGGTNLDCANGSVEMWFSPDWNSGDDLGAWGTLFEVGAWNTNLAGATGAWGLYISPDGSTLYFSAQTNGAATNYLSAPISWNAGDWHHIGITYSASNSLLYLEGQFVTNGPGMTILPGAGVLSNGFSIGSDGLGTGLRQARGAFNHVVTYSYQVSALTFAADYAYESQYVYPLPSSGFGDDFHSLFGGGSSPVPDNGYTTNDLWLQITAKTNTTAYLTIHRPGNAPTNSTYDLLYCTNLTTPFPWKWLLHTAPGQTNLVVSNAVDAQAFYRLGTPYSSMGTDLWVAFMYMVNATNLSVYISSPFTTTGQVAIPVLGITNTFTLTAGGVTNMPIDGGIMPEFGPDDSILTNSVHVTASQPVSVYAFDYAATASAAFTCYPTPLLGTNYCIMARASEFSRHSSRFDIVATENETYVTITPSDTNEIAATNDWAMPIELQQGETYQLGSTNPNLEITNDLTGTWISSTKPVAVFAGADAAFVPDNSTAAANPLVQEQLPVESWGTQALSIGFAGRLNGDTYRVLAAYSNTVVTITTTNGTVTNSLTARTFCDTNLTGPVQFQANQPIQVAHIANGSRFDSSTNNEGDPCEILLPPMGHYLETNIVYTPTYSPGFDENFLNLIVPQSAISNTVVDGSTLPPTNFVAIGTSGFYGAQRSVTNGVHKVISSQPVGVEVYGWGLTDAYGYCGGLVK